jgi:hypothetical protein
MMHVTSNNYDKMHTFRTVLLRELELSRTIKYHIKTIVPTENDPTSIILEKQKKETTNIIKKISQHISVGGDDLRNLRKIADDKNLKNKNNNIKYLIMIQQNLIKNIKMEIEKCENYWDFCILTYLKEKHIVMKSMTTALI